MYQMVPFRRTVLAGYRQFARQPASLRGNPQAAQMRRLAWFMVVVWRNSTDIGPIG
jgi:hypothetical protein